MTAYRYTFRQPSKMRNIKIEGDRIVVQMMDGTVLDHIAGPPRNDVPDIARLGVSCVQDLTRKPGFFVGLGRRFDQHGENPVIMLCDKHDPNNAGYHVVYMTPEESGWATYTGVIPPAPDEGTASTTEAASQRDTTTNTSEPLHLSGAMTLGKDATVDVVIDGATITAVIDGKQHTHTVAPLGPRKLRVLGHWDRQDVRMMVFGFTDARMGQVVAIYGESTGPTDPDYLWYIDRPEYSGWGSLRALLAGALGEAH